MSTGQKRYHKQAEGVLNWSLKNYSSTVYLTTVEYISFSSLVHQNAKCFHFILPFPHMHRCSHPHLSKFKNTVSPKAQMTYCTWPQMHMCPCIYTQAHERAIPQHPRSIRPVLIPARSSVQCSCIYRSQASTPLLLQHSVLITFLCFLFP